MSVIKLRKLTRLSLIELGRHRGSTVGDILQSDKFYLIHSYFKFSSITFTDDILDELCIPVEDRIPKPGKDPGKINYYYQRNLSNIASEIAERNHITDHKKVLTIRGNIQRNRIRTRSKAILAIDRARYSKMNLQARNHGKFPK